MNLDHIKKILVVRFTSLGDILLTTPLLRSLKGQYPNIQIDFCILSGLEQTLQLNPYISELILYKKDDSTPALIQKKIHENSYDLIIDLQNNHRSHTLLHGLKSKTLQFNKRGWEKWLLVNLKINMMDGLPQIPTRYAQTIPKFKLDNGGLDFFLPDSIQPDIAKEDNYIGFCPVARHYTKMWPYDYFAELGEILSLHKFKVVLFGGKNDRSTCNLIASTIQGSVNLSNNNDLYRTAINMKECKAIVCNDSGLMHLASAMQVPVISIFGSTVPEFGFSPYKVKSEIIQYDQLKCRPCSHIGRDKCPQKHFHCMLRITPATVFQHLTQFLVR